MTTLEDKITAETGPRIGVMIQPTEEQVRSTPGTHAGGAVASFRPLRLSYGPLGPVGCPLGRPACQGLANVRMGNSKLSGNT